MWRTLAMRGALPLLLLILVCPNAGAQGAEVKAGQPDADVLYEDDAAQGAEQGQDAPAPAQQQDLPTSGGMQMELSQLGEELCLLALTNFHPGGGQGGSWSSQRTQNAAVNHAVTEFAKESELAEGDKVVRVTNEVFVSREAGLGETIRLSDSYKDMKSELETRNGPMGDDELDELILVVHNYLGPVRVHRKGNNFGPADYCFKSVFETLDRKFRLNIIKRQGKVLWFVEDVI